MKKWIVAASYSGHEKRAKEDIEKKLISTGKQEYLSQILIPEEEYQEKRKDGTLVTKTRTIYPGYIYIELVLLPNGKVDEDVWFYIRNTKNITGILGSSGGGAGPSFVTAEEMKRVLERAGVEFKPERKFDFNEGDTITVKTGPWSGNTYKINSINEEKEVCTVFIEAFGRQTPLELKLTDIEKN